MALEIIRPGMLTTIQDRGRFGYRRDGVVVAGAMDQWALRIANLLVGNLDSHSQSPSRSPNDAFAAIEFFLVGPTIDFHQDTIFAIYGGCWNVSLNDQPIRCGMPYLARVGQRLEIREATAGAWGYLAINGVFDIPKVLGSQSTHTRSTMGGFEGRALKAGDKIGFKSTCIATKSSASVSCRYVPWTDSVYGNSGDGVEFDVGQQRESQNQSPASTIRFVQGSHWGMMDAINQETLINSKWIVSKKSDRMGYRLERPIESSSSQRVESGRLQLASPFEMLSEPNTVGTIQLPSGGDPIILMSDAATTGGYPRIGHVAQVDLPRLAQQRPGAAIELQAISTTQARQLLIQRERLWRRLSYGVRMAHSFE
jgi:antagonist of KipI